MLALGPCFSLLLGLVAVSSSLTAGPARADIYQCQGPDGSVHYTNVRPTRGAGRCRRVVQTTRAKPSGKTGSSPRGRFDRSPDRYTKYDAIIRQAARIYQLPEAFLRAVVKVESDFSPEAVSRAGAMGMMQLMPATARAMGVQNAFDPRQNILGGARFLRVLANKFNGDLVLTIAAYNAGDGAVAKYRGVPPYRETRRYVRRVLSHYYAYKSGSR